ncbi:thiol reductase thioredoxin [Streptococcus minor]|uniref:Thiol reductase thioredoxin n=1 Tax=Streptococcus minor TaxID=229549 RepID=A0A3P1VDA0_9STRE|nr:conjugal transfer protein TraF [Streptococcus minor]RRD31606.1 thiol reductase thioredoxin [Streptococcus minor]
MFFTNTFNEDIQDFQAVSPQEARELLEAKDGAILFLGRETCPYCRRFAPKLAAAAKIKGWTVYFLHTQNPAYSDQEVAQLREEYKVPTVPGLLHAKPSGIQVRCDSSMSEEEIVAFIQE